METIGGWYCRRAALPDLCNGMLPVGSGVFCGRVFRRTRPMAFVGGDVCRDGSVYPDYCNCQICDGASDYSGYGAPVRVGGQTLLYGRGGGCRFRRDVCAFCFWRYF